VVEAGSRTISLHGCSTSWGPIEEEEEEEEELNIHATKALNPQNNTTHNAMLLSASKLRYFGSR
jgi:hypothetical protein